VKVFAIMLIGIVLLGCLGTKSDCTPRPAEGKIELIEIADPKYCIGEGPVTKARYCNSGSEWINISFKTCRYGDCGIGIWRPVWPNTCVEDDQEICAPKDRVDVKVLNVTTICR
jgi:hypothetical protein